MAADHYLGDALVVAGDLDVPRSGTWTADVVLSSTTAPDKGAVLPLVVGGFTRLGCVVDVGADYAQPKCRVVGGRGKLEDEAEPRQYRGESAARIAQDALQDAGEVGGDWTSADFFCGHWLRSKAPYREVLRRLLRAAARELQQPDLVWRVQPDGAVAAVVDAWAASSVGDFDSLASFPQERLVVLGMYSGGLQPGTTIQVFGSDRRVERVLYSFDRDTFTASAWYQ